MKSSVVVQGIHEPARAYDLLNYVRHVIAVGCKGGDSPEFLALPKDSPIDQTDTIPRFLEPVVFEDVRFGYADTSRTLFRMIFHFVGGQEDLWNGTRLCMDAFRDLQAVIVAIIPDGSVFVARIKPDEPEPISKRFFPAVLADKLEEEFVGTGDELDLVSLERDYLRTITKEEFLHAFNRRR